LVATSIRDLNDKSARVRANAATNLHNIGPSASGAVPRLVSMLSTERDADVRQSVADAIGAAGRQSPEAVPALIHVLRHEHEHEVRGAAAKALGRMGLSLELSVPALIAALKDDAEDVRAAAAEALSAPRHLPLAHRRSFRRLSARCPTRRVRFAAMQAQASSSSGRMWLPPCPN
jgi:HEAT repeat protein